MQSLSWILAHSYPFIFLAMMIEGPIVTFTAAIAAHLGYFNIISILLLSISADITGDIVYYSIGRFGRHAVINRFGPRFKLTPERVQKIEKHIHQHPIKTILAMKLTPLLAGPGLMIVGASRVSVGLYILISVAMIIPNSLIFGFAGYLFGSVYTSLFKYLNAGLLIVGLAVIGITLFFIYRAATKSLSSSIENLEE